MSGEAKVAGPQIQNGPHGHDIGGTGFTPSQLTRIDEALTLSSRESGLTFSVYVGALAQPTRGHAEALFEKLADDSVLLAVSPGQRVCTSSPGPARASDCPTAPARWRRSP